ncbi:MAG: DUF362 domain-containing protein [Planctomycetes bacterium]|nr:DUF362 domain-containing protein [Planctomycetota bacterium]MBU1517417.1 DUF362 domain-containing protein [Planctomycetota bacterium]MBU2457777.1 DUF362 domain-containing protein [Planctomycetota bacterium]MBU2597002.1 DUF362 domain-containing protein [Planctomycetota bacterium]
MNQVKVSLVKCADYDNRAVRSAILRHFELQGGIESFISKGDSVLIKPNMIAPKPASCATQTDPAVIVELAKILLDFGARPFVGDSPAWANMKACSEAIGIVEPLAKLGVGIKQLRKPVNRRLEHSGAKIGISSIALGADKIINLPKLKTHQQLIATIAVKNMFGCVSGKAKAIWHYRKGATFDDFCTMLIDIYKLLNPVITIIDGVVMMEGPGPISGNPKRLGWLIGATDPIAAEIICCDLIGISPEQLPMAATARKIGFGCTSKGDIQIVGDLPFADSQIRVVPAELTPLRFSFPRIIKSIVRQIWILMKAGRKP